MDSERKDDYWFIDKYTAKPVYHIRWRLHLACGLVWLALAIVLMWVLRG